MSNARREWAVNQHGAHLTLAEEREFLSLLETPGPELRAKYIAVSGRRSSIGKPETLISKEGLALLVVLHQRPSRTSWHKR